jgi:hypothetical protein
LPGAIDTSATGSLGDASLITPTVPVTGTDITSLPDEFTPTNTLPDDTYTSVPSDVMAPAPDLPSPGDIVSTLPDADASALAASAGSSIPMPSAGQIASAAGSIGKLINGATGAGSGVTGTGQEGFTSASPSTWLWLGLAAAAAVVLSKG